MSIVKYFFCGLLELVVNTISLLWRYLIRKSPSNKFACLLKNIEQMLLGRHSRFYYSDTFTVRDNGLEWAFNDRLRGFRLYEQGLSFRSEQILKSYYIGENILSNIKYLVDCGANYGDLILAFIMKEIDIQYFAFEPSQRDFRVLEKNISNYKVGKTFLYNMALSDYEGTSTFYLKESSGDSSLVPINSKEAITVEVTKLDNIPIPESKGLFKLEAEGSEPEVLKGASNSIKKFSFVVLDGGYERGLSEESTFESCCNMLTSTRFELLKVNLGRNSFRDRKLPSGRALFRNMDTTDES